MAPTTDKEYPLIPILVPLMLLKAAQACTSSTDDYRPLLRGMRIKPDGFVEAGNGVIAFRGADLTHALEPIPIEQIVMIHGKLPSGRDTCQFEWNDADHGIVTCIDTIKGKKSDVMLAFEVLHEVRGVDDAEDEIFPDFGKLFAHRPEQPLSVIGFDTSVLNAGSRVFGSNSACTLTFRGTSASVVLTPTSGLWSNYKAELLLMPMSTVHMELDKPVATVGNTDVLDQWSIEFHKATSTELDDNHEGLDDLYDQAKEYVIETRKSSISGLQRALKVGYNRAARLIEQLEAAGVLSAVKGNGTREVLE